MESFLESNSPGFLVFLLSLDDSIDSGNFSVKAHLPLICKDSVTNMHGPAVHVKETHPFVQGLSLENSADPLQITLICYQKD